MIGAKIRSLRTERGLKQSELADMAGLSRISIGNYERGSRKPPVDVAAKIADALGVTVDYLLKDEPDPDVAPDKLSPVGDDAWDLENMKSDKGFDLLGKIVQGVGQLPQEDQEEILVLVEAKQRRIWGK